MFGPMYNKEIAHWERKQKDTSGSKELCEKLKILLLLKMKVKIFSLLATCYFVLLYITCSQIFASPTCYSNYECVVNPLSANPNKWPNILKRFAGNSPMSCLSVFGHFVGLTLKGLKLVKYKTLV